MAEARRRIEFFWVNQEGVANAIKQILPTLAFSHSSPHSCYYSIEKGTQLLFMKIEKMQSNQFYGFLGLTRMDDLPAIDNLGTEKPLNLNTTEGLLEKSHFFLTPKYINGKKGFALVFEYNHFGPRISRFGEYLANKLNMQKIGIMRFVRKDLLKEVEESNSLRSFQLKFTQQVYGKNDKRYYPTLFDLFQSTKKYAGETCTIIISAGRSKKSQIGIRKLLSDVIEKIQRSDDTGNIKCAKIKYVNNSTDKIDLVNLLQANIEQEIFVEKEDPKHRNVKSESMYSALEDVYNEIKNNTLKDAGTVGIWGVTDDDQGDDNKDS